MNKHCFRTIFSKTLQRIVVVSELAKLAGKSESESMTSGAILQKICKIRPLAFSLFCALGFVTLSDNAMAETLIIQADSTAPKNQQPIILQTANGLPQINIQTPNDKGLSHNKYSQFDVAEKGAILNNSRTNTATQQAGMVQGNPYLARGEAKVILNEVNSSKPSVMKGYVEVAGKKAEVIIANPSGLHCDGCGIINADRATLTTGKPQINQGNLEGFVVEKGKVTVAGKGLDNSRVDYTDILAREAKINAGVWSKKETKVITGKNTVKRSNSDNNLQIIHTNQPLAGEEKPTVAIDVGELGGMYAGKIHLIGTEQGVGVRNAGHIGASADTLTIDSQGRIVNSGTFNAQRQVQLNAQHGIDNQGKIENKQGNIQLNSKADIQNSGSIVARGGNIQKKAETKIQQSGETVAKGNITYTARQIHADKNSLIAAGVDVTDTAQGEVRKLEAQSVAGKTIQLTAPEKTTVQGKNIASGKINVAAAEIDANQSQNNAHTVEYSAKSGDIQANSAQFSANQIKLTTPKWLSTEGSQLTAEVIEAQQANLNARGSVWKQTGEQDFRLKAESIHTDSARFSVGGHFEIDGNRLTNNQGLLSSGKRLGLNLNDAVDSVDGKLVAKGELSIRAPLLNNQQGLILSGEKQAITVNTLKNQSGVITSQTEQTLDITSELQNQGGRISASGVAINAQSLDNREQGEISSVKELALTVSQQVDNRHGVIQSVGNLTLNSTLLDNQGGVLKSATDITLNVPTVLNNRISENGSLIEAGGSLTMNSFEVENQGTLARQPQPIQGIIASQFVLNSTKQLNNEKGGIYIGSSARFTLSDSLNNRNGEILSWGDLAIFGGKSLTMTNTEGKVSANNGLEITAKALSGDGDVQAGDIRLNLQENFDITKDINANRSMIIQTEGDILNRKKLAANDRLQLTANQITNAQNARISSADTRLTATSTVYNEGLINSRSDNDNAQTVIKAQEIHNIGTGNIYGDKVALGAERILNQDKDGTSATIAARQSLGLAAKVIENNTLVYEANKKSGSLIYSGGEIAIGRQLNEQDTVIGNAGQLHNRSSIIEAEGRIQLNADKVANVNSHYRSELETTDRQTVNEHFILPRDKHNRGGSDVYDNGHLPTINVNQLRKGYYRKTWSYWQKYDEANLPVITDISQLNATTVLAKPYAQSCANDESVDCTLLPAGNYKKDNPVWTWFNLTPPAEDAPEMTPEIIQAMNEEDLANQHLSEAEQEKLQKEQGQGIAPVVPARPIEPVRGSTETEAQYQKRLQTYQAELKAYEAAEAAYQRYVLLKPLIDWEAKYGANIQALDEAIAKHNKANLSQEYPHFWNLWIKERMVKENITKASLPAQILAGGDLTYQSDEFINDKSWVIAGKALNPIGRSRIANLDDADAVRQDWELGRRQFSFTEYHGGTRRRHSRYDENDGPLARLKEVHKDMNIFVELENTSPTAYTDYVDAKAANAVKPEGNQVERGNLPDAPNPPTMAIERIPSPNAAAFEVRSMTVDTRLPNQGLYRINPQADSHVLIETDPDFTDKKRWLSSDYMFNALRHDHNNVHKRLGDGFYEQRLIREQINRLTGRQFLGDYTDFDSQYKALMDAGITFAQKFNLRLGITLSPEQVASLTSDIVWFETQTVRLPSGETVSVLVPKVYVLARKGDIDGKGSLISADALTINSKEIVNQGTIAGRRLAQFNAERLENSGTLSGGVLAAKVSGDLENIGGKIEADKAILLDIAGNFNHTSTTRTTQIDLDGFKRAETNLDRKALLHVKDENGLLQVQAGNITSAGADIINDGQGQTYLSAKNQLNLTALQVGFDEKMGGGNHYRNEALNDVVISRVQGKGDVVVSGKNLYSEGADLDAKARLALLAENDMVLGSATRSRDYEEYHKTKSGGALAKKTKTTYDNISETEHKGTELTGEDILVKAGHDIQGESLLAVSRSGDIDIIGGNNVTLSSATNQLSEQHIRETKRSGFLNGGEIGFTIGSQKTRQENSLEGAIQSTARNTLGSEGGNIRIQAGNKASVSNVDVLISNEKTAVISGKNGVRVESGKDVINSTDNYEFSQSGLSIALSTPVTDAVQSARQSVQKAKATQNEKLKGVYAVKAAEDAVIAAQNAQKVAETLGNLGNALTENHAAAENPAVKISVSLGTQKQQRESRSQSVTHSKSTLNGGNIALISGAGKVALEGVDTRVKDTLLLDGKLGIESKGVADTYQNNTKNKNHSASVGVFIGLDRDSFGIGFEAGVSGGKGKENIETETWQNNQLQAGKIVTNSANGKLMLDATNVKANHWEGEVQDFEARSRQDISKYKSEYTEGSVHGTLAVGTTGVNGHVAYNGAKLNTAQVENQTAIDIGKSGMDVKVKKNAHFEGAVMTSQAEKENNRFQAGTLTTGDIENHSELKTRSVAISGGTSGVNPMSALSLLGNKNESERSTTKAAIGENIAITLTEDLNAETTLNHLNRDTQNANQKVTKYDISEVKETQELVKGIGEIAEKAYQIYTHSEREKVTEAKLELGKAQAQKASKEEIGKLEANLDRLQKEFDKNYGTGSKTKRAVEAVTAALQGLAAKDVGQAAVGLASPYLNAEIKKYTEGDTQANLIAHALLGAVEAAATGNNVLAGAAAGAGSEAAADFIVKTLYKGKSTQDLTEAEKQNVALLSQLASGLASGLIGDSTQSAAVGADIGKRAVENNYLSNWQEQKRSQELKSCHGDARCENQVRLYWGLVDIGQDVSFVSGAVAGVPENLAESVEGLISMFSSPIETIVAMKELIAREDTLSYIANMTKQEYLAKLDKMQVYYEQAGAVGSFNAGKEFGNMMTDVVTALTGAGALVKTGVGTTAKIVTKSGKELAIPKTRSSASLGTCSFHGDMEVKTDKGYRQISSIKVGDKVLAKNERTGITTYQKVQAHYSNPYDYTVYVEVADSKGKYHTIVSNKIHPFFTQVLSGRVPISSEGHSYNGEIAKAQWVDAQHLQKGYRLLAESGEWQTVTKVKIKQERLKAYNMTVEKDHTYFIRGTNADNEGVWVHNDCWHALPNDAKQVKNIDGYKAYQFTDPKDGKVVTVVQKDLNRFETPNHQAGVDPHFNRLSQQIDAETGRYLSTDNPVDGLYNRAYLRSETLQKIYANYEKLPNGNYRNKLTRQEIEQPIDIGHMYGWEHRRLSLAAKELNWSQKQFNDYVNARPE
ncbi:TPA: hemagglutinin repeat-containing protein, partial [Mannheimia haemolytica]|nr:hemagglutinin repeat-containing protein [Mannheimia haemolytica]HDL5769933.1 hemagglutinin repeat-containing protein [Mannheimia haemolytica]